MIARKVLLAAVIFAVALNLAAGVPPTAHRSSNALTLPMSVGLALSAIQGYDLGPAVTATVTLTHASDFRVDIQVAWPSFLAGPPVVNGCTWMVLTPHSGFCETNDVTGTKGVFTVSLPMPAVGYGSSGFVAEILRQNPFDNTDNIDPQNVNVGEASAPFTLLPSLLVVEPVARLADVVNVVERGLPAGSVVQLIWSRGISPRHTFTVGSSSVAARWRVVIAPRDVVGSRVLQLRIISVPVAQGPNIRGSVPSSRSALPAILSNPVLVVPRSAQPSTLVGR